MHGELTLGGFFLQWAMEMMRIPTITLTVLAGLATLIIDQPDMKNRGLKREATVARRLGFVLISMAVLLFVLGKIAGVPIR